MSQIEQIKERIVIIISEDRRYICNDVLKKTK